MDDPNNVKALAIETELESRQATPDSIAAAGQNAQKGLQALGSWTKPEGMSDQDFQKLKDQMAQMFNSAAGLAALQTKDYATARKYYLQSVHTNPNNLQDVYRLAIAYLEPNPLDLTGFWYGAKALNLAAGNAEAIKTIAPYIKAKYKKYHGKADDWDKFAATVAGQTEPPSAAEMAALIPPAPTPCDIAVETVKTNDVTKLSFDDREFILSQKGCSPAGTEAADKVWRSIQDLQKGGAAKLKISVKVVSANQDSLDVAVTDENQQANPPKADMHVVLDKPLLKPPAPNSITDVVGVITNYTPVPFMFTMEQGELPAAKPATPAKRPVHHAANRKPPR